MQATRIIAIRHGETAWNVGMRLQGHTDIGLNARGEWQAQRVAQALAEETIDAIYSSDLSRAHATAQAIAQRNTSLANKTVATHQGLRERGFGSFEGSSFVEIESRWPDASARWRRRDLDFAPGGGETLGVFYARCVGAASRIAAAHPGEAIALVAHGGVLDCLYRAASHIALDAPRSWEVGNATINRLLYTPQGFTLIGWGDSFHLEGETASSATVET